MPTQSIDVTTQPKTLGVAKTFPIRELGNRLKVVRNFTDGVVFNDCSINRNNELNTNTK